LRRPLGTAIELLAAAKMMILRAEKSKGTKT
jgi:hypothetical protein